MLVFFLNVYDIVLKFNIEIWINKINLVEIKGY